MKLTKSIVDENFKLLGFFIEGTAKEFRELGKEKIERAVQLSEMVNAKFENSQISCADGKLREKAGFRINKLTTVLYQGGNFTEISNEINITKRVLVNGELKGFEIMLPNNSVVKYTYDNVIRLANWCNPGNFILRTKEDKTFIAGKAGVMRLGDLPEIEIGNSTETGKKKRTSVGGQKSEKVKGENIKASGDLLSLYSMIRSCDGLIIKLPDEEYKATGEIKEKVAEEFKPLGIGEIGSPYIDFGEKKLNANTTFKKVGNVTVTINGMPMPVYTFTYTSKIIFVDGKNHIKRFGVGVTQEVAKQLIDTFGKELITKTINDRHVTEPIVSLTGKKDFVFFEVDTTKMEIMSKEDASKYLLSNNELKGLVQSLATLKAHNKVTNEAIKKFKEVAPESKTGTNRPLFGLFAGMNQVYLDAITDAGVDVFTGAYIKREKVDTSTKGAKKDSDTVMVEYDMVGSNITKLTYDEVVATLSGKAERHKMCDDNLLALVKELEAISNIDTKLKKAEDYKEHLDKMMNAIKTKLWLHKVAMYTLGDGNLEIPEKTAWIEKQSRSKVAKVYECVQTGCTGLVMKLTSIEIK